jgi:predicted phage terminase large subunit-like protein
MATDADVYLAARKGLVEYRSIFLPTVGDVAPASFHYEWSRALLGGEHNVAFEGFRESAKSSIIMRSFPLYALTFPSEKWKYIVILKSNMSQARKALKNITNEYMNNPLINARLVKVIKNTSDVFEVVLDLNGKDFPVMIEAYGKGASIRGLNNKDVRPSIIIADDLQDSSDMNSEVVPEQDWDWFLSDVMFLAQSARVFIIGNNLGERCIIERIGKNADSMGFKFKRIPCADSGLTVSAWPEKQSIEEIRDERDDYEKIGKLDVWLREKMCTAVNDEIRLFRDDMYRYYPASLRDTIASSGEILATLDPASSKRRDSCFRAIVVGSLMPDGHWYVLDVPYGRWDSVELMGKMFEVVRKWGVREFGIEKGQYQQFLEPVLYREMTIKNCRFNITALEHGKIGSKLERIKMLQPYFKSGSIWFPDQADWLNEVKMEFAGVTRDELKSEFVDLIDAMAMLVCQMRVFTARSEERRGRYELTTKVDYPFSAMSS